MNAPGPAATPIIGRGDRVYGRASRDRRIEARRPDPDGARAALETFYFAFNQRSLPVFKQVWAPDPLVSLYNPVGGVLRGNPDIEALYDRIFHGPARVWVEFHDVVEYLAPTSALFAGRERGQFTRDGITIELAIRTSRTFHYLGQDLGWRQVHHHGSIDDPDALATYQEAVRAPQ